MNRSEVATVLTALCERREALMHRLVDAGDGIDAELAVELDAALEQTEDLIRHRIARVRSVGALERLVGEMALLEPGNGSIDYVLDTLDTAIDEADDTSAMYRPTWVTVSGA